MIPEFMPRVVEFLQSEDASAKFDTIPQKQKLEVAQGAILLVGQLKNKAMTAPEQLMLQNIRTLSPKLQQVSPPLTKRLEEKLKEVTSQTTEEVMQRIINGMDYQTITEEMNQKKNQGQEEFTKWSNNLCDTMNNAINDLKSGKTTLADNDLATFISNVRVAARIMEPDFKAESKQVLNNLIDFEKTIPQKFKMTTKEIEKELLKVPVLRDSSFVPFEINHHKWIAHAPRHYFADTVNSKKTGSDFAENVKELITNESLTTIVNLMTANETATEKEQHKYKDFLPETVKYYKPECWGDENIVNGEDDLNKIFDLAKKAAEEVKKGNAVFVHCRNGLQRTPSFIAITELFARDPEQLRNKSPTAIKKIIFKDLKILAQTAQTRIPTQSQLEMLFSDAFIDKLIAAI